MLNFNKAEFEYCIGEIEQAPVSECPEIVFSGRSNVGKSSFINKILSRKSLARISSKPGKTVTINFYRVENIRLVDMPGYGYARVSVSEKERWSRLVEGYFNSSRNIALVFQIVDLRHPPSKQDMEMISYLSFRKIPFVVVATKLDKLNKTQREKRTIGLKEELSNFNGIKIVLFSAVTGEGSDKIREIISSL